MYEDKIIKQAMGTTYVVLPSDTEVGRKKSILNTRKIWTRKLTYESKAIGFTYLKITNGKKQQL